jgi:hypothetical protein
MFSGLREVFLHNGPLALMAGGPAQTSRTNQ